MIGLDTFSWYKLISFYNNEWKKEMTNFLTEYQVFITHEVKIEYSYRYPKYLFLLDLISILPRKRSLIEYDRKKFDVADITLLEYAESTDYLIITEDQPMLAQGVTRKRNILQFSDLLALLYIGNIIDSKDYYQMVKKLREMKNITKKKEKSLMNIRNN
jgi:predicted nuclease of predicted toxin-antitoxin system